MARTVTDAAILLGALEGAAPDPKDPATSRAPRPRGRLHAVSRCRRAQGRAHRHSSRVLLRQDRAPGDKEPRGGLDADRHESWPKPSRPSDSRARSSSILPTSPASSPPIATSNFLLWPMCAGVDNAKGKDADCSIVFKYGMKRDFNKWLASLGSGGAGQDADRTAPVERRAPEGRRHQVRAGAARQLRRDGCRSRSRAIQADRAKDLRLSAARGHRRRHEEAPAGCAALSRARAARPSPQSRAIPTVIVPFGLVPNAPTPPFPERVRGEAGALRRELHRHGLQRAAADRARVRVRAGHRRRVPPPSAP